MPILLVLHDDTERNQFTGLYQHDVTQPNIEKVIALITPQSPRCSVREAYRRHPLPTGKYLERMSTLESRKLRGSSLKDGLNVADIPYHQFLSDHYFVSHTNVHLITT